MLISKRQSGILKQNISEGTDSICPGLCLSARWKVAAQAGEGKINLIILPNRDEAEYCASDLYNSVEGDIVFFLPDSALNLHKSNFKASAQVQRTSAIKAVLSYKESESLYIVSYPEALEEKIPDIKKNNEIVIEFTAGTEISHEDLARVLVENGFERVDFVARPGQFALRGSIADIFSYGFNHPYRINFFGDEADSMTVFDANTQLSVETVEKVSILKNLAGDENEAGTRSITEIFPASTVVWTSVHDLYDCQDFYAELEGKTKVYLDSSSGCDNTVRFNISTQPVFSRNFELLTEDIKRKYSDGFRVYIYTEKRSQADRIRTVILENGGILPEFVEGKTLHKGFIDYDDKICYYSEHDIFERFHRAVLRRSVEKTDQLTLNDLAGFQIGDYVVHIDMGIGIYGGLVRLQDEKGKYHEVVKLQYKDGDVVFISVHSLHKISKYRSKDGEPPKINRMGSKSWQAIKSSAKSKVKDIAKELIQLYAKRKASPGYAFASNTLLQNELESSFEWEDTPDQEKATEAIKRDMEANCPMDRLICGDVGFGKTELAIRAAFKAVCDGKQVAVLVPTTILCLQHYKTFLRRLKDFACEVDYVSRLRSPKEVSAIIEKLAEGKIDILVGTHKILSKDFHFKDLGLLIIDEEQKFGVSAKEKLRQMKMSVDTLTMTATPIPRTLQFSLLGARDLSIINTPPPNRVPVQTEIMFFNKDEIRSIINYEIKRGGQIFFVHNRVEELDGLYEILHRLVPDMSICIAHGQMEPKELENKVLDFMAGEYDMLLCTTIVENGLDIPNANTIIINQAQNIGLSDLHQLRGRVGRSRVKGFCYLIVPPLTSITEDARRRLQAIEAFSDLGSGFNIAMQDLDIRGAGNLLGAQQSGFIADMGMETYQKILAEAMEEMGVDVYDDGQTDKDGGNVVTECTIDTDCQAFIPDSYIDVPMEKIRIYKQLDSARDDKMLKNVRTELTDRYGAIPPELEALFSVLKIRTLGKKMGFEKIIIKNGLVICFFISNTMSAFFRSKRFDSIINAVIAGSRFEMKKKENSIRLVAHGVNSLDEALKLLVDFFGKVE